MHELISLEQANLLMRVVLVLAPVLGLVIGVMTNRIKPSLLIGLAIGVGNFALWSIYNAITNRLGLDTVLNLEVNLALFVIVGAGIGVAIGWFSGRRSQSVSDRLRPEGTRPPILGSSDREE